MKKSQLDEILRLQSEDLNEVEVKYEESTKEANQYQKELQEEIKQLENKIVELEDQEEELYTEKSKAKINETEMKKQLLTLQEEFNILNHTKLVYIALYDYMVSIISKEWKYLCMIFSCILLFFRKWHIHC